MSKFSESNKNATLEMFADKMGEAVENTEAAFNHIIHPKFEKLYAPLNKVTKELKANLKELKRDIAKSRKFAQFIQENDPSKFFDKNGNFQFPSEDSEVLKILGVTSRAEAEKTDIMKAIRKAEKSNITNPNLKTIVKGKENVTSLLANMRDGNFAATEGAKRTFKTFSVFMAEAAVFIATLPVMVVEGIAVGGKYAAEVALKAGEAIGTLCGSMMDFVTKADRSGYKPIETQSTKEACIEGIKSIKEMASNTIDKIKDLNFPSKNEIVDKFKGLKESCTKTLSQNAKSLADKFKFSGSKVKDGNDTNVSARETSKGQKPDFSGGLMM